MKLSARTVMKIARLYGLADGSTPLKAFRQVAVVDRESFVQASFVLQKQRYSLLYGSVVDETTLGELWPERPDTATLLPNPLDQTYGVTPFQGKFVALFHLKPTTQRLDTFLATQFDPSISRSRWQKYITAGAVTVNGILARSNKQEINDTDDITVSFPEPPTSSHTTKILYEDTDVIVLHKPAGMLTHAKGGVTSERTVADVVRPRTTFATHSDRPGIIHRLDRDTSGVLIIARTPEAARMLQQQFAARTVQKTYLAIVSGLPTHHKAQIDLPIGRSPAKPSTFRVDPNGKPAQTLYEILDTKDDISLIKLQPRTGRTHQLRVHLSHLGTPIVGDRVYGQPGQRLFLHAYQLTLTLPNGQRRTFTAPLPGEFLALFPHAAVKKIETGL